MVPPYTCKAALQHIAALRMCHLCLLAETDPCWACLWFPKTIPHLLQFHEHYDEHCHIRVHLQGAQDSDEVRHKMG